MAEQGFGKLEAIKFSEAVVCRNPAEIAPNTPAGSEIFFCGYRDFFAVYLSGGENDT